ncbi:MAG: DUF2470 domain-containing protein [Myxococcota bacterium]
MSEKNAATHQELAREARALLWEERWGALSTLSQAYPGYPFGSVAPYALSARGEPLILISTLAVHTRNLQADPRCSLMVLERAFSADPQACGRLTLLGRCERTQGEENTDGRARYLARHPQAAGHLKMHDFHLHVLRVEHVRFIAGFGRMGWLNAADLLWDPAQDPVRAAADDVCAHMNQDHRPALKDLFRGLRGMEVDAPVMTGVDAFGLEVRTSAEGEAHRFHFSHPVTDVEKVRQAVIELIRQAREGDSTVR